MINGIDMEKGDMEGAGGISFEKAKGEIKPPLEGYEAVEEEETKVIGKPLKGKVPISPAMVKPPLRFEGLVLAEVTGYPGWIYTEEDLEDIATLIQECGFELDPRIQVFVALGTLHAAKFTGYLNWKRSGRPRDIKKRSSTGEERREDRPGEGVAQ